MATSFFLEEGERLALTDRPGTKTNIIFASMHGKCQCLFVFEVMAMSFFLQECESLALSDLSGMETDVTFQSF